MYYRLGGLLALGPRDGLDGAERAVEPGLLGGLHFVEGQTQVVLQVLMAQERHPSLDYHRTALKRARR